MARRDEAAAEAAAVRFSFRRGAGGDGGGGFHGISGLIELVHRGWGWGGWFGEPRAVGVLSVTHKGRPWQTRLAVPESDAGVSLHGLDETGRH